MKRTPLDAAFSDCVRERSNWTCERCHKIYTDGQLRGKAAGLHCSHYFGRGSGSLMRHYGENCFAHCHGCHQYLSSRPHAFALWVRGQLGDTRYDELVKRWGTTHKRPKGEEDQMTVHFRAQFKYQRRRRNEGQIGRIDFMEWD